MVKGFKFIGLLDNLMTLTIDFTSHIRVYKASSSRICSLTKASNNILIVPMHPSYTPPWWNFNSGLKCIQSFSEEKTHVSVSRSVL